MKEEKNKEEEEKPTYILKEVVTSTDIGIGRSDDDSVLNDKQLLLEMINKLDRIERAVA